MWTKQMELRGLSKMHLQEVAVYRCKGVLYRCIGVQVAVCRSRDLKQLDTSVHLGFGDLVVAGEYNCTGHLGTVWLQLPVDRSAGLIRHSSIV